MLEEVIRLAEEKETCSFLFASRSCSVTLVLLFHAGRAGYTVCRTVYKMKMQSPFFKRQVKSAINGACKDFPVFCVLSQFDLVFVFVITYKLTKIKK